ncbi:MAG: hypothetical protein LBL55_03905, partial [Propionibacteriaceae bacterium]|nr:hypothetical protein [Propionibacteriaceae bacterium]
MTTLTAAVSLASIGLFVGPDAWAEPPLPQYLSVIKSTEGNLTTVTPGQTFTYDIVLSCSEQNCLDAAVVDALPAELAGLSLVGADVRPSTVPHQLAVTTAGQPVDVFPAVIGPDSVVSLSVTQPLTSDGAIGLFAGQTMTLQVRLSVPPPGLPTSLNPLSPNVGHPIVNTAASSASNSAPDTSSTAVTISVPQVLQASLSKSWNPNNAAVGQTSTVNLTARNTSNVPVDRLVVTEPAQPGDGSSLDADNVFGL